MPDNPRPLSGDGGGGGGSRGGGQVSIGGNAKPVVVEGGGQSPTRATRPSVVDAVDVDVDNVDVAADGPGFGDGRDDDQMTMGAAISLQRDWAHVEWSGEELLPERQARLEREGSCGLSAAARESGDPGVAETAFVLSAAVVAQVRMLLRFFMFLGVRGGEGSVGSVYYLIGIL